MLLTLNILITLCVYVHLEPVKDWRYTFYLNTKFYLDIFCDVVSHSVPPDLMSSKSRVYFPIVTDQDHNITLHGITSVF